MLLFEFFLNPFATLVTAWLGEEADQDDDGKVSGLELMYYLCGTSGVKAVYAWNTIYVIFITVYMITGSFLVFGNWKPNFDEGNKDGNYCDAPTYIFAYVYLIIYWVYPLVNLPFKILLRCIQSHTYK